MHEVESSDHQAGVSPKNPGNLGTGGRRPGDLREWEDVAVCMKERYLQGVRKRSSWSNGGGKGRELEAGESER